MFKLLSLIIKIAFLPISIPISILSKSKSKSKKRAKVVNNKIISSWNPSFKKTVRDCNSMNTDLVEMTAHSSNCPECAKYEGKIYSISGKSKKYPPLPENVQKYGIMHPGCHHDFYPFIEGVSRPAYKKVILQNV